MLLVIGRILQIQVVNEKLLVFVFSIIGRPLITSLKLVRSETKNIASTKAFNWPVFTQCKTAGLNHLCETMLRIGGQRTRLIIDI